MWSETISLDEPGGLAELCRVISRMHDEALIAYDRDFNGDDLRRQMTVAFGLFPAEIGRIFCHDTDELHGPIWRLVRRRMPSGGHVRWERVRG